ncbi:hypothetical protein BDQ12DRAFT_716514 [Crucibulum laeve]|uniref:Uncharacterized protein n=1 Tax=Crucibulum laeve TaxID=68775 RepID=A0A5C3LJ76_9AGAR|nr:hypothetical protein BDQ12DRAFT_716514 [Crucibulum laeve]
MAEYTLNVQIDPEDLQTLKESKYNLCIARKVNGVYNVVWSGDAQYLANNKFSWVDEYQVFGINKFKAGALVKASTNPHDIESGQTCEMNEAGVMSDAFGSTDTSGKFKIINKFGKVSFGVNAKFGDQLLPIFVTPTTVLGTAMFEPITAFQVWFSLEQKTGTMILAADSEVIQVKYQGKALDRTVAYKSGKWSVQH